MDHSLDVKLHFLDYWRIIRIRLGLVFLVFLLVFGTVAVVTYFMPREYSSFATIELQPDMTSVRIFDNQPDAKNNPLYDPKFVATQFQIITRKGVLYPVIDQLDLQKKWGANGQSLPKEIAYNILQGKLSLQEVRNTTLIQITVFSIEPAEAALLANTIAQVYMNQRIAERQEIVANGLEQLRDEVKKQESAVNEAYAEASKLRTENGISDPNPDSLDNSMRVEDSSVLANQAKVDQTQSEVATLRSRVEQLDQLKREDLMRAAGLLNLNDPIIEQKLPIYQSAQAEKARLLSSGLGKNHPDVKAQQAQIDVLEQQLSQQIDSILKGLQTQLEIAQNSFKAIQGNLTSTQDQQQQKKTASVQYLDAKYRYIQERKLLEGAKTRLNTELMERTMPQQSAAIRDRAEPALFPSRPKVLLNLMLAGCAGIALGIGLAFFLEYLDTSVKTMDGVEKVLELPVLGLIPKGTRLLTNLGEDSADAEAYRILSTNLEFSGNNVVARTISVVSGGPSEGKSTTTCNLAITFAAAGQRALIVDADMRRPSQHQLLGLDNRIGLSNYLSGSAELGAVIQPTSVANLYFMPSGSRRANVLSLLKSERMHELVESVKNDFDVTLFDCTPMLGISDAGIVISLVDAVLLVVQPGRFPRSMLLRVKNALNDFGATVLGVVLNNVDVRHDEQYRFYTTYGDYYDKPAGGRKPMEKAEGRKPMQKAEAESSILEDESSIPEDEY
jgi:succinoglycan biosynthesis transport protein ExoP